MMERSDSSSRASFRLASSRLVRGLEWTGLDRTARSLTRSRTRRRDEREGHTTRDGSNMRTCECAEGQRRMSFISRTVDGRTATAAWADERLQPRDRRAKAADWRKWSARECITTNYRSITGTRAQSKRAIYVHRMVLFSWVSLLSSWRESQSNSQRCADVRLTIPNEHRVSTRAIKGAKSTEQAERKYRDIIVYAESNGDSFRLERSLVVELEAKKRRSPLKLGQHMTVESHWLCFSCCRPHADQFF
jgi:hypothetical protein